MIGPGNPANLKKQIKLNRLKLETSKNSSEIYFVESFNLRIVQKLGQEGGSQGFCDNSSKALLTINDQQL